MRVKRTPRALPSGVPPRSPGKFFAYFDAMTVVMFKIWDVVAPSPTFFSKKKGKFAKKT